MSLFESLRERILGTSDAGGQLDDPRDYVMSARADCPDCGPCVADCFAGTWKCGRCGGVLDRRDLEEPEGDS